MRFETGNRKANDNCVFKNDKSFIQYPETVFQNETEKAKDRRNYISGTFNTQEPFLNCTKTLKEIILIFNNWVQHFEKCSMSTEE